MLRSFAVATAVAALGLALVTTAVTEASARPGGGFRGGSIGFRSGGAPGFRGFSGGPRNFVAPRAFRGGNPGVRFANPGYRRFHGGLRRFGPGIGFPLALGAYGYYNSYNDCIVPQNVLTPYGWQLTYVNVCDDYYPY